MDASGKKQYSLNLITMIFEKSTLLSILRIFFPTYLAHITKWTLVQLNL